ESGRQDGGARLRGATRGPIRQSLKRLDHDAVENGVEESAFERDQEQLPASAIGSRNREVTRVVWSCTIAHGVLESVQIVEHVWRTQELQQTKARVSDHVD